MSPFNSIMSQYHLTNDNLLDFITVCILIFFLMFLFYKIHRTKKQIESIEKIKDNSEIIKFFEGKFKIYTLLSLTGWLMLGIMIMKQFL